MPDPHPVGTVTVRNWMPVLEQEWRLVATLRRAFAFSGRAFPRLQ